MQAHTSVAVVGATGRLGRPLVEVLTGRGFHVVPLSRSTGVDVTTGVGVEAALTGVECVVDASGSASPDGAAAAAFFTATAHTLQTAGDRTGVRLLIGVSVIGADLFTSGYFAAKKAHEQALTSGPVPVHILRAAQFHELVPAYLDWGAEGDVIRVPRMRTQLVAALTVAEAVADLIANPADAASTARSEIAGPRAEQLVEAASLAADRGGRRERVEAVADDPEQDLLDGGALLPTPLTRLGGPTFAAWLDESDVRL